MTIAVAYVSPEGVVLGADSTASAFSPATTAGQGGFHYFNHNQKVFEIGENSTYAMALWGLGSVGLTSYRTLIAQLADSFATTPPKSVQDVANQWVAKLGSEYASFLGTHVRLQQLKGKSTYNPQENTPNPNARTQDEEKELADLNLGLGVGFYVGGYHPANRKPEAYRLWFDAGNVAPTPQPIPGWSADGAPNIMMRLLSGYDAGLRAAILGSSNWTGTPVDLDAILAGFVLSHPLLPIRDAVDFVHACILSTIKAMKFSSFTQICGGPVELAVVTTDRKFRWVRHKLWDAAIVEGEQAWLLNRK